MSTATVVSRIRPLSRHVINHIAAGEVIERPASVLKELLENCIDAQASRIDVELIDGGAELIRVTDDGVGIHPDDLPLSVLSHATSKLEEAEQIFQIHTLGFRGEALASIAEISRLSIRSRQAQFELGAELVVEGGNLGPIHPCGCPVGTQIEVRQLFYNTPVRRKFLRGASTEIGHLTEQFQRIALANQRIHLTLTHNRRKTYELPATDSLLERIRPFAGKDVADQLIPIEGEKEGWRVWGYVGHPQINKPTRKGQFLFLNGRWFQDRTIQQALIEAFRGLLMVGRYPICYLFLEAPRGEIDVNVHPMKSEVRFRDVQAPFRLILSSIRTRFLGMNLESPLRIPQQSEPPSGLPASGIGQHPKQVEQEYANWVRSSLPGTWPTTAEPGTGFPNQLAPIRFAQPDLVKGNYEPVPFSDGNTHEQERGGFPPLDMESLPSGSVPIEEMRNLLKEANPILSGPPRETFAEKSITPAFSGESRALQIHDSYLVVETADGLSVIDQHALHERILYEQFRTRVLAGAIESQRLLIPEAVELSPQECLVLLEQRELLAELGFDVSEFGGQTILLSSYPVMLGKLDLVDLLKEVSGKLLDGQLPTRRALLDCLLHMMSCKAAVKAGQRLTPEEIESLLLQRHLVEDAHHCPHGRPTALNLSRSELDRQFGRLG